MMQQLLTMKRITSGCVFTLGKLSTLIWYTIYEKELGERTREMYVASNVAMASVMDYTRGRMASASLGVMMLLLQYFKEHLNEPSFGPKYTPAYTLWNGQFSLNNFFSPGATSMTRECNLMNMASLASTAFVAIGQNGDVVLTRTLTLMVTLSYYTLRMSLFKEHSF